MTLSAEIKEERLEKVSLYGDSFSKKLNFEVSSVVVYSIYILVFSPRAFDVATTSSIGLNVCAYGNVFSFSHMEILTVIFYFRPWPATDYV